MTQLLKNIFLFIAILSTSIVFAQQSGERDTLVEKYIVMDGDSIPMDAINLNEVVLLSKLEFSSKEERLRYLILRRKTRKVYPYAKIASERLVKLNSRLDQIKSKRDRRRYTKIIENYVEDEFSSELKKLTRTEGQILVKLMHRQTGTTTFELIKELKSGWRAFWYNTTASMFDISLKVEYDPANVQEDYLIEDILQRSFRSGILEPQPTALDFEFLELTNKWK